MNYALSIVSYVYFIFNITTNPPQPQKLLLKTSYKDNH